MAVRYSARDVDVLVDLASTLLQPSDPRELAQRVLPSLHELVPAATTMWAETNLEEPQLDPIAWPDQEVALRYAEANPLLAEEHPHPAYVARTGDGSPHMISDFLTEDEFHATRMYEALYRPLGIEDEMGTVIARRRPIVVGIVLSRPERSFTARDRRVLNLVRPLITNGYRNADAFARHRAALEGLEDVATRADEGLLIVDRLHRMQYRTSRATTILEHWWPAGGEALPAVLREWLEQHRPRPSVRAFEPLVLEEGDRRLVARVLWNAARTGDDAIVLTERTIRPSSEPLAAFGLTARQRDVLSLVALGRTNDEVARDLDLKVTTVQKHLEHIYHRLGVHNRTSAARLALEVMFDEGQLNQRSSRS